MREDAEITKAAEGLNPFFIRSAVGIPDREAAVREAYVLIPSSSGLRLEWDGKPRWRVIHTS